jgi:dipeptidyl aminopeptidase/acylaminoacyl peptidase
MYRILILSAAAALLLLSCQPEKNSGEKELPAPLLDTKSFFKNAHKSGLCISPDGVYYSYRDDYKGKLNIFVQKITDTTAVRVTNDTMRSIVTYFWKDNRILYLQDTGGDENYQLFSVKVDGSDLKALTPFPGVCTVLIDRLKEIPGREKELIIGMNKRKAEVSDPYLLDVETGSLILLYNNRENFDTWITDNKGAIRLASRPDGVATSWSYRNSDKDPFAPMITLPFAETFSVKSFDKDNKNLYVLSNAGRDKVALIEYDPVARKEVKELYSNKEYDLDNIFYDRKKEKLVSVSWTGEKPEQHFFDGAWEGIYKKLEHTFEGYVTIINCFDDTRTKGIVGIYNERMPGRAYICDLRTGDTRLVTDPLPWIIEKQMSHTKPVTYKARDGLVIHGYLTVPVGLEAKNLPAVVLPHGGPWNRDEWGFDREVQFLANRGYAVLQMNFRGSTGYGKKFYEAGFKQWGRKMQNDVSDGAEWLKKQGIADSQRIAIMGGSYGGYATLAGVTFTPGLYAAGVADVAGGGNMFSFIRTLAPGWGPYIKQFYEMVGDPNDPADSVMLAEISPALHADRIKVPLFISQGANDPRVSRAQSDTLVAVLKKRGVYVEYMVKENEGHGFLNQDNLYDYYAAVEKFLDKYVKNKQAK